MACVNAFPVCRIFYCQRKNLKRNTEIKYYEKANG